MDAFFASVEQRDNPEYRGKPLIVGGSPDRRGVVCAASYEARRFSVRSAMPSRTAGKLCPEGIFVKPRMDVYREESSHIMAILREAAPMMEPVSVDEAYMDLSAGFSHLDPDAALQAAMPIARVVKERIARERGLTASIGVGSNKFLAKVGSDFQKPDGLTLIPEDGKALFLRPLPVSAIPGVGPVTAETLRTLGIVTIGDVQDRKESLAAAVGSFAEKLQRRAWGEDARELDLTYDRKSISSETTFSQDTAHRPTLRATLRELSEDVAVTLARHGSCAITIQVKVRYGDFTTLTRQVRLLEPLGTTDEIYRAACHLLARDKLVSRPLRLLGVGVSGLVPPSAQLRLRLE